MKLFLIVLLAIGIVRSHARGSPAGGGRGEVVSSASVGGVGQSGVNVGVDNSGFVYRSSGVPAFSAAVPVQSPWVQSYIRYIDGSGAERLIGYSYPQPLYGVQQQLSYGSSGGDLNSLNGAGYIIPREQQQQQPFQQQQYTVLDPSAALKARDEHFRTWCEQRYQALKAEIERLRAEGKPPSADILLQLQPLEQILSSTTSIGAIAPGGDRQQPWEEHQRIWDQARSSVTFQAAPVAVSSGRADNSDVWRTKAAASIPQGPQKEQLLIGQHHPVIKTAPHSGYEGGFKAAEVQLSPTGVVQETPEVMQARAEHFRLYDEVKQRAEKGEKAEQSDAVKGVQSGEHETVSFSTSGQQGKSAISGGQVESSQTQLAQVQQHIQQTLPQPVEETAEVKRAREEHLKLKAQLEKYSTQSISEAESQPRQQLQQTDIFSQQQQQHIQPHQQLPIPVQDTDEVKRAREEHFKFFNAASEALAKSQASGAVLQQTSQASADHLQYAGGHKSISSPSKEYVKSEQATKTLEENQAHKNHLKLPEAAKSSDVASAIIPGDKVIGGGFGSDIISNTAAEQIQQAQEEQRFLEAERIREAERLREQEKLLEVQRLQETERLRAEERIRAAELLRLEQEEEQRIKNDRLAEVKHQKIEKEAEETEKQRAISNLVQDSKITQQIQSSSIQHQSLYQPLVQAVNAAQRYESNPFLVRFVVPTPGTGATYALTEPQKIGLVGPTTRLYLPTTALVDGVSAVKSVDAGVGVVVDAEGSSRSAAGAITADIGAGAGSDSGVSGTGAEAIVSNLGVVASDGAVRSTVILKEQQPFQGPLYPGGSLPILVKDAGVLAAAPIQPAPFVGAATKEQLNALAALEQAKQEHFRAHEIALEQLRLAKLRNPIYNKDCILEK